MSKEMKVQIDQVSPIFEQKTSSDGDGFFGFTVFYVGDLFSNFIEFYRSSSKNRAWQKIVAKRSKYIRIITNEGSLSAKETKKEYL